MSTVVCLLIMMMMVGGGFGQGESSIPIYVSEIMARNDGSYKTKSGKTPDWLELYNYGDAVVNLKGVYVSDKNNIKKAWEIPDDLMVQPGEYVLVFADGSGRMTQEGAFADFKLNGDGEGIYLFAPDGSPIQKVTYPTLGKDESFGVGSDARYAGPVPPEDVYRVLMSPTPGAPNSASKSAGPRVDVHNVKGPVKDGDIQVTAQVMTLPGTPVEAVTLTYVVDYATDQETTIPMDSNGDGTYSASIPAQKPGSMVRWYVMARDAAGTTRAPPFSTPTSREYYGTVIDDPSMNSTLPVIYMFCKNKTAPWVVDKGSSPGCSVMVQGTLYDNVIVRRRGVSSLNWPKPKIKIDAGDQGKVFQIYDSNGREVKEFNLNSEWAEPGENTFMRETLGWRTFADMGVDALQYYQAQVRLNGEYFGKFSVGEDWDEGPLAENGYTVSPVVGPLMKSISGEFSNLRWDLDPYLAQYYYRPITVKTQDSFDKLIDFANGLAGANGSRTDFVFDNVSLPKVINFMAAQTLVLNQDRCTKNFYVYQDPSSYQWSILPWDLESTFSTDRGLGGTPAPDYCILACEQWNSPLFCDRNHPQDLLVTTPWGLISTRVNPDRGRRRLMQSETMQSVGPDLVALIAQQQNTTEGSPMNGAAVQGLKLPSNSSIPANYDGDQRANPIPEGARGTYNFLIDTILSIPETRAMYVRRLRTLMDEYYETGRLVDLVTSEYEIIKDEAKRDAKFWGNIGDPERGYTQLITEQIPIRKQQLYDEYGVNGPIPLIPDSQPQSSTLEFVQLVPGNDGYIELYNPNNIALDISNWKISGDGFHFTFLPGTVVPSYTPIFVAATSIETFKNRQVSPKAGEGNFVVGPVKGSLTTPQSSISIQQA